VLQSGLEDLAYARRIAQLRDYYFDHAPELAGYLLSPAERLPAPGAGDRPVAAIRDRRRDGRRDHRGTGRFGWGLLVAVASGHSLVAALVVGVVVAAAALTGLMRYQNSAWHRGSTASLSPGAEAGPN